ncbi:MAG TPA: RDD family protein [Pirellulales bacterium]|jgi:uncharacterized RDD family membrane protein YckC|nr:RDD family protein [Pirellulales bacterium]
MQYYVVQDRTPTGPFSEAEVRRLLEEQKLHPADLCWAEGMSNWVPLASVFNIPLPPAVEPAASYVYASFGARVLAFVIDGFIIGIPSNVIMQAVKPPPAIGNGHSLAEVIRLFSDYMAQNPWLQISVMLLTWLYFALMESSSRQATFGKSILGLKVATTEGRRLNLSEASLRFWAKYVGSFMLTCGLGCLPILFTPRRQALHDMAARTIVIRK